MPQDKGANVADLQKQLQQYQALFTIMQGGGLGGGQGNGLGNLPGGNLLSLNPRDVVSRVEALQGIPTQADPFTPSNELGFGPSGVQFTGGAPFKQDFTAKRIQNSIYLLNQLQKSGFLEMFKQRRGAIPNSVQTGQPPYGAGIPDFLKGLR